MKKHLLMMTLLIMNHDDPDNHDEGSRERKMCLNIERPVVPYTAKSSIYTKLSTRL